MNQIYLLLMSFWFSGAVYAQDGSFNWILNFEQNGKNQKIEVPARGTKEFQDLNNASCVFAPVSEEKIGKQYIKFRSKLSCKKGGGGSSSEFSCLDSAVNATPEVVKLKSQNESGGVALKSVQVKGATKEQVKGLQIKSSSGLIMSPDKNGNFAQTEMVYSSKWDKNGRQSVSSSTGTQNGVVTKTTVECHKIQK